jgi:hypothetical protein
MIGPAHINAPVWALGFRIGLSRLVWNLVATGGVEIDQMRGVWAGVAEPELQQAGEVEQVDAAPLRSSAEAQL